MTSCKRVVALTLAGLTGGALCIGGLAVYFGWYNVSAIRPHTAPVHRLMDIALMRSVANRSDEIQVPDLRERDLRNGFALFRAHCVQCHGAPGQAPEPFALGLNPAPTALVATARERSAAEIYWVVRDGIKMTGMPAWQYRLTPAQRWDLVAFLGVLPTLSPRDYRAWEEASPREASLPPEAVEATRMGDAAAGRQAMQQFLCMTCHVIPDVVGAYHHVGPSLAGIATRPLIAGVVPNTPENMQRWLMAPHRAKPGTAMPDLGIGAQEARDMAAFLATLSEPQ